MEWNARNVLARACAAGLLTTGLIHSAWALQGAAGGVPVLSTASPSSTRTSTASPSTTLLGTSCMTTYVENQPFTIDAAVVGESPTGTMSFEEIIGGDASLTLCSHVALSAATAFCTTTYAFTVPAGWPRAFHDIYVAYSGDSNNMGSTAGPLTVTVLGAADVPFRNNFEAPVENCPIE